MADGPSIISIVVSPRTTSRKETSSRENRIDSVDRIDRTDTVDTVDSISGT